MYLPKNWLANFGFSGGGEMVDGSVDGWKISNDIELSPSELADPSVAATYLTNTYYNYIWSLKNLQ